MRTKTFRPYDHDTLLLMPPSVRDWVPSESLAAFINDLVNEVDLTFSSPPTTSPGGSRPTTHRGRVRPAIDRPPEFGRQVVASSRRYRIDTEA